MRITKLIATLVVAGLAIVACQQDDDYVLPSLSVDTQTLAFTDAGASSLPLSLTATREWSVRSKPEWITVSPTEKGPASTEPQELTIFAAPNESYNQEGEIVFTIGLMKVAVAVSQPGAKGEIPVGSGTLEDPYTITGVLKYIATLGADVNSPQAVYVKGVIAGITEPFAAQYGNATFTMKEADSDGSTVFTFYRGIYLGNKKWKEGDTQIKEGDEVIICGTVVNFKGNTPETATGKAYVYSLNGVTQGTGGGGSGSGDAGTPSGTGTQADPYNAAAANAAAAKLTYTDKDNYQKSDEVYISGKISRIAVDNKNVELVFTAQYGNASFYISDDGQTGGAEFYCYRVLYLGNEKWKDGDTQIKVGDEVVICGKLMNYNGKTPETVANEAYIYSLTPGTGGGGNSQGGAIFSQAFKADGQGNFTIENKTLPDGLTAIWTYDSKYGMKATGYASSTNYDTESWLISPVIDLSAATSPVLTFKHAVNFFESVDKAKEEASVWAKAEGGDWAQLSGVNYPTSLSWTFVESGEVSLAAYAGKKVQIAFKYVSTATKAGTWELDEFVVKNK